MFSLELFGNDKTSAIPEIAIEEGFGNLEDVVVIVGVGQRTDVGIAH